jgi:beta-mannosidase
MDRHPNDPEHGSIHEWEVWNRQDYPVYRDAIPRFVAEFGWQGPPTWTTLTRSLSDDPLTPESPGMLVHQKALDGNDKLTDGLVPHLPFPADMDGWHWAMQLNQARAVAYGIEHYRSWSPRNAGTVVWQLNDCWPVTSWAAVDGDGRIKPLWHAVRSAYADRLITVQPRDDGLAAILVNDTDEDWAGDLTLRRVAFDGGELEVTRVDVRVGRRSTSTVPIPTSIAQAAAPERELLEASLEGIRGLWHFTEDRDADLPRADVALLTRADGPDTIVSITARGYVRDAAILVDRLVPEAWAEEGLITLLPGETAEVRLHGIATDAHAVAAVLRTANELVAGR